MWIWKRLVCLSEGHWPSVVTTVMNPGRDTQKLGECLESLYHFQRRILTYLLTYLLAYLLTYLLHGAESFLRS